MSDYPFTDFEAALIALEQKLQEIASARLVTRDLKEFETRPPAERKDGVFTILPGPREGYNYEHRPGDLPKLTIFVYGEFLLAEDKPPREIDRIEGLMARDLEILANEAPYVDALVELTLESITGSAQTMFPYASILAVFKLGVDR